MRCIPQKYDQSSTLLACYLLLELKIPWTTSTNGIEIPSMSIGARSGGRLVASNQRLAWDDGDVPRGDWHIVARGDEVLWPDVAISKNNTR